MTAGGSLCDLHRSRECVQQQIERRAAECPGALAVAGVGRSLTFGELNREANRLAHYLRELGVGPEVLAALLLPRGPEAIVAALAVLKAGGCYLPLDPAYPDERLAFTLGDSRALVLLAPRALLAERPALAGAGGAGARPLVLEALRESLALRPETDPSPSATLDHLAYVIYTSGSSGRPKGVEVEHRGLANLVAWHRAAYDLRASDRATRLAGSAFDASVWEVWPYLAAGASLHLPPDEVVLAPDRLAAWLAEEAITLSFLPTPLAEALLREPCPSAAPLRALLTGGDRLHLRPRPGLPFALFNHYGPTENSVVATGGLVAPAEAAALPTPPSIGRPIEGVAAHVADAGLDPVPAGAEGELLLGGLGLARGYRGRPELTAERFVPDPISGARGGRLYRTGDLVRGLPSGEIDFVGRVDFQVKVRGFRIELGEIEAILRLHPAVREAVVLALEAGERERRLVGYIVPQGPVAPAEGLVPEGFRADLAAWLGERLPEYMVPALFVVLERLPLTPNGKVDRGALAAPEIASGAYRPPATPSEMLVAAAFAEVLGLERAGLDADFFVHGGHSLRATQVASRLRAARGIEIPARVLFDHPTVARLAAWLDGQGAGAGDAGDAGDSGWQIAPQPRPEGPACELPASFAQQRLWLADLLEPGSPVYNTPFAFDLAGPLSVAALAGALAALVRRHEPLRTTFADRDGEVMQVIARDLDLPLPLVDLSALPPPLAGRAAEKVTREEARRGFDLARGPVLRTLLLRRAPEEHTLLVSLHHIVSDDWSVTLMAEDLAALYRGFASGGAPDLAPLPVQYADFSVWQRQWLRGEPLARQLAWWREQLRPPLPILDLPTDRPRPARQTFRGARLRRPISGAALASLRDLAARGDASPFMVLFAAWHALLGRYAGAEDLVTGTPIANRHRLEVERLVGFFVNTLALRTDLSGEPTLPQLVARVRESLLGAYGHQDLPFERLVEELASERDPARGALVDAFLILANAPRPPAELAPGLALRVREVEVGAAKVDLSLFLESEPGGGFLALWEYNVDLFDAATIERMAAHFDVVLSLGGEPGAPACTALPLLSGAERSELARLGAGPSGPPRSLLRSSLLHQLFLAQAERTPEATALVAGEERLSYADLAARVGELAATLRGLGARPEVGVAIFLERGADLVVSLLAVLASGGFYLPLDPRYPGDRLGFMIEDSGCRTILTQSSLAGRLPAGRAAVVRLDVAGDLARGARLAEAGEGSDWSGRCDPAVALDPDNLAYLIYTSGSTGMPKAVAIAHRSAVAMVLWARAIFSDAELAGVLAATSITFDLSVFEIFAPLAWGGTVILADDALSLPRLPARREVRLVNTVPSALAELLRMEALPAGAVTVNLAGEPLPRSLADAIHARPEVERLYNLYGPSEDTTYSTFALVERGTARAPAIGRPVAGSAGWVVGALGDLQPLGVPGELYLGGEGLARGYLRRPELTAERFVPDPFGGAVGGRLYRTGDLVRMRAGGELEYLGRLDHQVKVRGFRIELGEIERTLVELVPVEDAVVLALSHAARGTELVAFVVPPAGGAQPAARMREALRGRLPDYMIPARFLLLAALPLTPNGKIDRRSLARLGSEAEAPEATASAQPAGPIEEKVAGIFLAVLGVERIGAGDSFFEVGGNSLVATRVLARIRKAFAVELDLRALFEQPTVRGLASRIVRELEGGADPSSAPLVAAQRPLAAAPLSFAQERLWFFSQLEPGSTLYSIPLALDLAGPLSAGALAAALRGLVARHEVLRTTYTAVTGQPVQNVGSATGAHLPPLPLVDLSALAGPGPAEAERLALREAGRPFDLVRELPIRVTLLRLGAEDHRLLLTLHHIAADGRSIEVLLRNLRELYGAAAGSRAERLPALPVQVADFALWQRRRWSAEALDGAAARERERLAGAPHLLELPADRPRPARPTHRGDTYLEPLPEAAGAALEGLARATGATPFMVFLAALHILLGRVCGVDDLLLGSPAGGRTRSETEELIGLFLNTLVLRGRLAPLDSFGALLGAVREDVLAAFGNQELPFEKLVEALAPERQLARNPLFQVLFVFQGRRLTELELGPGLALRLSETLSHQAKFDLKLVIERREEGYLVGWEYSTDSFEAATVRRLARTYGGLVATFSAQPALLLAAVSLLSAAERSALLADWARPPGPLPESLPSVIRRFEHWAERTPAAPAVEDESGSLSYGELDARAAGLARRLARRGVGTESVVAICLPRSAGFVAAILGVMKAGAAYLALDAELPDERLAYQLRDSRAALLVGDAGARSRFAGSVPDFLEPDAPGVPRMPQLPRSMNAEAGVDRACAPFAAEPASGQLAYVIYTSGSTGAPKGVMVEQGQLASYVAGVLERMEGAGLWRPARFATVSTFAADLGHTAIFPALASGGTLVVVGQERIMDPDRLAELFATRPVDLLKIVPSHLAALLTAERPERILPRRLLVLGGEAAAGALLARVRALAPACRVLNHYGPTETTVGVLACSTWEAAGASSGATPAVLPLGRPLGETRAAVVDAWEELAPIGVAGELRIGGPQVARGYLGRPDLTAERFVPEPHGGVGARLYRTGDRVLRGACGAFEFLGRIDQQVKIRGFRVEPGEIEAALRAIVGVDEALVVARRDLGSELKLVGYLVCRDDASRRPSEERIAEALRRRLPEPMVPACFVFLDAIPLTANGKVDRAALPDPRRLDTERAGEDRPLSAMEWAIAETFSRILERDDIAAGSDFFQLGGHSLAATRAVMRLRRTLGMDLELRALFDHPTVERLALHLERAGLARRSEAGDASPGAIRPTVVPVSLSQQRIWLLGLLSPASALFNMPSRYLVEGPLSLPFLRAALHALVERHEALRTLFTVEDGEPVMILDQPPVLPFLSVDLTALSADAADRAREEIARWMAVTPFALEMRPLLRVAAVRGSTGGSEILLTLHHLVSDGWSNGLLLRELAALYGALETGGGTEGPLLAPLQPLARQYSDFALWQRRWLQGEELERQLEFWRRELASHVAPLELPTDRPRQAGASHAGSFEQLHFGSDLLRAAEELGRRQHGTLFVTLLAAFEVLLARQAGRERFTVGVPVANREGFDADGIVGCFVNTLVVRSDVEGAPTFADLVGRVRERMLAALGHQDIPFERLVDELAPARDLARPPLCQVLFTLADEGRQALALGERTHLRLIPSHSQTAKLELLLNVSTQGAASAVGLEYRRDLWDAPRMRRFAAQFVTLLRGAVAAPEAPLDELPWLSEAERHQLAWEWSGPPAHRLRPEVEAETQGEGPDPAAEGYLAPRSEVERTLASIWAEVLGHDRVGLRQSFWEIGGHSLLAAKVLARIAKAFAIDLPFDSLFKCPRLGDFALLVEERLMSEEVEDEVDVPLVAR